MNALKSQANVNYSREFQRSRVLKNIFDNSFLRLFQSCKFIGPDYYIL